MFGEIIESSIPECLVRIAVVALMISFVAGCAAPVFNVPLDTPGVGAQSGVTVKDGRMDKRVYMTGISWGSASNIYLLTPEPALEVALERHISSGWTKTSVPKAEVIIEELDLKNLVGFAKADELSCRIESSLSLFDAEQKHHHRRIRTFTKNNQNMSPLVVTAAKTVLSQCLRQHAMDLVGSITD